MKKLMFFIALLTFIFTQSCEKMGLEKETVLQTVDATLKVNESYTFTLPTDIDDDAFAIIIEASNASISRLSETTYEYTPNAGFTGTDIIVLSNAEEREMNGCHPHGDSIHPQGDSTNHPRHPRRPRRPHFGLRPRNVPDHNHYTITLNFTVVGDSTNVKFVK